jgi:hypothetical protein
MIAIERNAIVNATTNIYATLVWPKASTAQNVDFKARIPRSANTPYHRLMQPYFSPCRNTYKIQLNQRDTQEICGRNSYDRKQGVDFA